MCRRRERSERMIYPWPQIDFIDLTMDDLAEEEGNAVDNTPRNDQWNYPYNLLPSSDEEEHEVISFIDFTADGIEQFDFIDLTGPNETNQNTNASSAASVNISFDIAETRDSDRPNERNEFELNIPQILLSMSRISNNLLERASTSQD